MRYLLLILLPTLCFAECDISGTIESIRPGAEWKIKNNDISTLVWLSTQPVPTKAEVTAAVSVCQTNETNRKALKQQARLDVKNSSLTQGQRLQALLILLDYDQ